MAGTKRASGCGCSKILHGSLQGSQGDFGDMLQPPVLVAATAFLHSRMLGHEGHLKNCHEADVTILRRTTLQLQGNHRFHRFSHNPYKFHPINFI